MKWLRRYAEAHPWRVMAAITGCAGGLWLAGLFWFAGQIPLRVADPVTRSDAIVVLTGGSNRLRTGLDLLSENLADKLFVSGVYRGVDVNELLEVFQRAPEELSCCITLGYDAVDTVGNAAETAAWMRENEFTSLRIVTANYHLPRGLMEFRRAMPDITFISHPVFSENVRLDPWWRWPGTARLIAGEYNKYLASKVFGRIFSKPFRPNTTRHSVVFSPGNE